MEASISPNIAWALQEAQRGVTRAREDVAQWMLDNVTAKVQSVLGESFSPTTHSSLISDVILKLVRGNAIQRAPNLFYLHAAIAQATRELLVDAWRQRERRKKNGTRHRATTDCGLFRECEQSGLNLIELCDAIDVLERIHARKGVVVTLRYFCGLSVGEVASELGVSTSTVEADWRVARAWLFKQLRTE